MTVNRMYASVPIILERCWSHFDVEPGGTIVPHEMPVTGNRFINHQNSNLCSTNDEVLSKTTIVRGGACVVAI